MKISMLILALALVLQGCKATRYYRVTFQNGDIEYFALPYKVKKGAKSINYEGQTILGIEEIEEI